MDQMDECVTQTRQSNRGHLRNDDLSQLLESCVTETLSRFMLPFFNCQICGSDHFGHVRPIVYDQADDRRRHRTIFVTSIPSSWSSTGIPKKNRNSCSRMGMLLVNDIYKSVIRLSTGTFLILILATGTLSRKPKTADTTTTSRVIGMTVKNSGRILIIY